MHTNDPADTAGQGNVGQTDTGQTDTGQTDTGQAGTGQAGTGRKAAFPRLYALRFFAALLVVAHHARGTILSYFPIRDSYPLLGLGAYGADLFFVISGFVVVLIGSTRECDPSLFIRRRIERIVPFYWAATIFTFAVSQIPGLARGGEAGIEHLVRSLLFVSWLSGPDSYPVLNVGWTLEYEMFFYLIAAIGLAVAPRPWLFTSAVMLGLVATGRGTSSFLQHPVMLEFVFGMAIGCFLYDRRSFAWIAGGSMLVLLGLPVADAAWRVWLFGLPFTALVAATILLDWHHRHRGGLLARLGKASFSIYLVHVLVISAACKIVVAVDPTLSSTLAVPVVTVLAIAAGYVLYLVAELPLIRFFHR